jgi:transcriptional regulator with XRE-family HTH domain
MEKEHATAMSGIGARIRVLAAESGLSLAEIERRAGLGNSHLSQIILGRKRPQAKTLRRLSRVIPVFAVAQQLRGNPAKLPPRRVVDPLRTVKAAPEDNGQC